MRLVIISYTISVQCFFHFTSPLSRPSERCSWRSMPAGSFHQPFTSVLKTAVENMLKNHRFKEGQSYLSSSSSFISSGLLGFWQVLNRYLPTLPTAWQDVSNISAVPPSDVPKFGFTSVNLQETRIHRNAAGFDEEHSGASAMAWKLSEICLGFQGHEISWDIMKYHEIL